MKIVCSCSPNQPQFAVLPPAGAKIPSIFRNVRVNNWRHDELLAQMQRLRGKSYLEDGAIRPDDLTGDGRHTMSVDQESWHVLSLDSCGRVVGCLRYLEERSARNFEDLWVRHSALARCPVSGRRFRRAVETTMRAASQMRIGFGEVGGWAVEKDRRLTLEPLRILLATYGLLQLLGSATGVATATARHGSSAILRKIGLTSLQAEGEELGPYYDPQYGCQMEVLQFDSRFPNPKYRERVMELSAFLSGAPLVCRATLAQKSRGIFHSFEASVLAPSLASV